MRKRSKKLITRMKEPKSHTMDMTEIKNQSTSMKRTIKPNMLKKHSINTQDKTTTDMIITKEDKEKSKDKNNTESLRRSSTMLSQN